MGFSRLFGLAIGVSRALIRPSLWSEEVDAEEAVAGRDANLLTMASPVPEEMRTLSSSLNVIVSPTPAVRLIDPVVFRHDEKRQGGRRSWPVCRS